MIKDKLGRRINAGDGVLFSLKDNNDIRFGTVTNISDYYIKIDVNDKRSFQILLHNSDKMIKLSSKSYIAKELCRFEHG